MKKIFSKIMVAAVLGFALTSLSGCLSLDSHPADSGTSKSSDISLAGTIYDDSYLEHGIIFKNETDCTLVHHGEPPSELREGTYKIGKDGKSVVCVFTGPWKYDLPPEMLEDIEYNYLEEASTWILTTEDNFETLYCQPYGPESMELTMERVEYDL